jgi:hypothetical protein
MLICENLCVFQSWKEGRVLQVVGARLLLLQLLKFLWKPYSTVDAEAAAYLLLSSKAAVKILQPKGSFLLKRLEGLVREIWRRGSPQSKPKFVSYVLA